MRRSMGGPPCREKVVPLLRDYGNIVSGVLTPAMAMIFVPLPRLVGPTAKPPFFAFANFQLSIDPLLSRSENYTRVSHRIIEFGANSGLLTVFAVTQGK